MIISNRKRWLVTWTESEWIFAEVRLLPVGNNDCLIPRLQSQTMSTATTTTWAGRCGAPRSSVWRRWSTLAGTSCSPSTPPSALLCWPGSRSARRTWGRTSSLPFQRCWDKREWDPVTTATSRPAQTRRWAGRKSRPSPCWRHRCRRILLPVQSQSLPECEGVPVALTVDLF